MGLVLLSLGAAETRGQQVSSPETRASAAAALLGELGCVYCHTDLKVESGLRERTPDLSSAGLRYNPAYLFDYLRSPVKVRQHLGRGRMPDFHLTEPEALGLVAFLSEQREVLGEWPEMPPGVGSRVGKALGPVSKAQFQAVMGEGLICLTCHTLEGKGGVLGVELANIGYRLEPDWVKQYLVAPARFGVTPTTMPSQFYEVSKSDGSFQAMVPEADRKIEVVAGYLFSLNAAKREVLEKELRAARASFPGVDAGVGEEIFRALNCAACHRHHAIEPRSERAAPDLTLEGQRVNRVWLEGYLRRPVPIRPFGFRPGDGSRMPNFRLTEKEVAELSEFLSGGGRGGAEDEAGFEPQKLSRFSRRKAKRLLAEKLSCLGCHRLGVEGGRIAPALSGLSGRLRPEYVHGMIKDPRRTNPHAIMPRSPMTERTVQLIANFLLEQEEPPEPGKYLSLVENRPLPLDGAELDAGGQRTARSRYLVYCAACHGEEGKGDGFNARFLGVVPTIHADAAYMSMRPDDTLYDGIAGGGFILNKSHLMPGWGGSFTPEEMRGLVKHLRKLCDCQGPGWSLDN